ncbi:AraC family transcriptional regulator [Vibrio cincinnatiensis]|nr:AraC family transcriptional regulator [Vibrio cincinnatiensis]
MMENSARHINQCFWKGKHFPQLVIRSTQDSRQAYKMHSHSEFSIGIMTAGRTCLSIKQETMILSQGEITLIEPEEVHACNPISRESRSYHMLYVDHRWCLDSLSRLHGFRVEHFVCDRRVIRHAALFKKITQLIPSLILHDNDHYVEEMKELLHQLLFSYCSPLISERCCHRLAHQVQQQLLKDITQPPLLDTIAQEFGYSQESIIRIFKQHFGITPKAFLNNYRIEQAKLRLQSGMKIVDVAYDMGFSDQSQLHRMFVNYTASTPKQYKHTASILDNK